MKFDELTDQMLVYENAATNKLLPNMYTVLRLDGHGFSSLTKRLGFEKPFDIIFRNLMETTAKYLLEKCHIKIVYGYFESDEISLLLDPIDRPFDFKDRKLLSLMAGEASVAFTLAMRETLLEKAKEERGVFDNRYIQLPTIGLVRDYFRWRNEDANRNALNGWCYWMLRLQGGLSQTRAQSVLEGKGNAFKNDLLMNRFQINYNDVPSWQKRGVGMYWQTYEKTGFNKMLGQEVQATRKQVVIDYELPMRDAYGEYVVNLLNNYIEPKVEVK